MVEGCIMHMMDDERCDKLWQPNYLARAGAEELFLLLQVVASQLCSPLHLSEISSFILNQINCHKNVGFSSIFYRKPNRHTWICKGRSRCQGSWRRFDLKLNLFEYDLTWRRRHCSTWSRRTQCPRRARRSPPTLLKCLIFMRGLKVENVLWEVWVWWDESEIITAGS